MTGVARRKRLHPAAAGVGFLICLGIAGNSVVGVLAPDRSTPADAAAVEPMVAADAEDPPRKAWTDLLLAHGSFDRASDVHLAFASADESAAALAAPAGETRAVSGGVWIGEDLSMLRLGVVMVSAGSSRAVLGGRVVGVGDAVAEGRVVAIDPGQVALLWRGRRLTYGLDGEAPREFRGEMARRAVDPGKPAQEQHR